MKTTIIILFATLIMSAQLSAQSITGKVVDFNNQPIEFANVILRTPDSTFVSGASTNNNGVFELTSKERLSGDYQLTVSSVGYSSSNLVLKNLSGKTDVGTIILENTKLQEITVTAARSIAKIDRQLIYPTQNIIKKSTSGYDVLNKLMLPSLKVDLVNKSISKMDGGNVPIYINDKKATQADVISLRPDEIIRVEYIDAPGIQYAEENTEAVVHFIVKRRESGFVTGINTTNAVTTGNGNNLYFFKYNHKLSEIGVNYSMDYGIVDERYINQIDTYKLSDATTHIISREGINTHLKYMQHRYSTPS